MSAEAIARLRRRCEVAASDHDAITVFACDIRALIAAHDEAVAHLRHFALRPCDDSVAGYVCACNQCRAHRFLAKAGGK